MAEKYIRVIPTGGFSDILGIIHKLTRGSAITDLKKTILLDGLCSMYKCNFADIFTHPTIVCNSNEIEKICATFSEDGKRRLEHKNIIRISKAMRSPAHKKGGNFSWIEKRSPHSFGLLHALAHCSHNHRGSSRAFASLIPNEEVLSEYRKRHSLLSPSYLTLHIRNTDLETDLAALYEDNAEILHSYESIHVATDCELAAEFFKKKSLKIKNFSHFGRKIQNFNAPPKKLFQFGTRCPTIPPKTQLIDLFCDLLLGATADQVIAADKITRRPTTQKGAAKRTSGFSILIKALNKKHKQQYLELLDAPPSDDNI